MRFYTTIIFFCVATLSAPAFAVDGNAILHKDCVSCHNLAGPAPQSLKEIWASQGPDLFYAGNKYREEWLVAWLQKPQRIRPAGEFYEDHIKRGAKQDEVDIATLPNHVTLSKEDAVAVAGELMRLKPQSDLIAKEKIEPGAGSKSMGKMVFDKFLGCMACHRIAPDVGGLSGPELYTAGKRLQPAFIASYIRSPQAWDPKIWMPNRHVSDSNIQKLTGFIEALSEEQHDGK